MEASKIHSFDLRVYYEDTDLAGIVYYANYLKFIERARSEWVRDLGIDQSKMRDEDQLVFAVRKVEADYLAPAKFDDVLTVTTRIEAKSGVRLVLDQQVNRDGVTLFTSMVTLVCLGLDGQVARLPAVLRRILH